MRRLSGLLCVALLALVAFEPLQAQSRDDSIDIPDSWMEHVKFRSIGPANMMGRITSIAVYENDPSLWWAASASGGLLKTENNGITFTHQFDREATVSIGDVQVAQSDPNIVWVGTGEANPRNSVSWGNGVYKSTDGGTTWTNMGLQKSFQIGRIAIHPENPDVVYVGALGRLWGPNEDRGLYKTEDGGESWKKVLHVDDMTGVIDVQMHPTDPDTLLIATYERQRDGFDGNDPMKKYGDGSAIYRTTDGGQTFEKLTNGLPSCKLGRIGLQFYRANPDVIYAIVESEKIATRPENYPFLGLTFEQADLGLRVTRVSRNSPAEDELNEDDIVFKLDGEVVGKVDEFNKNIARRKAGDKLKLEVARDGEVREIEIELAKDESRGTRPFTGTLGGQAANQQGTQWQDGLAEEEYGGVYRSEDGGDTFKRINTLNPRPMYYSQLRVDPSDDTYMYVLGTSLYRSKDNGAEFVGDGGRGIHPDNHAMWIDPNDGKHMILGCDGGIYVTYDRMDNWDHLNHAAAIGQFYHVGVGPGRDYNVYGGLQDNGSWGGPAHKDGGSITNNDWFRVGGGDGFICLVDPNDKDQIYWESQNGNMGSINLRTGRSGFNRPRGRGLRFNWKTPFILSPHNSRIFYSAGNYVFKSITQGTNSKAISPEITITDNGAGSAISESPVEEGLIYVGTTDGAVWMKEGDGQWKPLYLGKSETAVASADAAEENVAEETDATDAEPAAESGDANAALKAAVAGTWVGEFGNGEFSIELSVTDEGKIKGVWETGRGSTDIVDGKYDAAKKSLVLMAENERFDVEISGTLKGDTFDGEFDFNGGQFTREFQAKRDKKAPGAVFAARHDILAEVLDAVSRTDDPVSGQWKGSFIADFIPEGRGEFSMSLKMNDKGQISGTYSAAQGDGEIVGGEYSSESGAFEMLGENDEVNLKFTGKLKDGKMTGSIDVNDGMFNVDFEAMREKSEAADQPSQSDAEMAEPENEKPAEAKPESDQPADQQANQEEPSRSSRDRNRRGRPGGGRRPRQQSDDSDRQEADEDDDDDDAGDDDKPQAPTGPGSFAAQLPGPRWVSSIEASRFDDDRCYISFDGHRSNDDEPYVFMTEDKGKTWKSIRGNLPTSAGSVRCVREDVVNEDLLYLGCEFSAWVSVDRGQNWTKLSGLPTVAVHEIAVHPTAGEIVAGTHGRSLWIADVTGLRQLTSENLNAEVMLMKPNTVLRSTARRQETGADRTFNGTNRSASAQLYYHLKSSADNVSLVISDIQGNVLRTFADIDDGSGLHMVEWDLRRDSNVRQTQGRGGRRFGGRTVDSGLYLAKLTVDGREYTQPIEVVSTDDPQRLGATELEKQDLFREFVETLSGDDD